MKKKLAWAIGNNMPPWSVFAPAQIKAETLRVDEILNECMEMDYAIDEQTLEELRSLVGAIKDATKRPS